MPPLPPLVNTVKLQVIYTNTFGTKANNFFYALMGTGWSPTIANLNTVAANLKAALAPTSSTGIVPLISNSLAFTQVNAFDNGGTTENEGVATANYTGSGAAGLTPGTSLAASWTIPAHYRGGHPRTYFPSPDSAALNNPGSNIWKTTIRTAWAAFCSSLLTSFNAAVVGAVTEALGTVSHYRGNALLSTPVFYPYSGGIIHGRVDHQRRRDGKESTFG